jgi:hypothetical protein
LISGSIYVYIYGTNIDIAAEIDFGGITTPINYYYGKTKVRVVVPAVTTPGAVDITVTNPDGQSAVLAGGFTYNALPSAPAPTLTGVTPNSGLITGGVSVYINGTNIDRGAEIDFGGIIVPISYYNSSIRVTVTVPAAASPGPVYITVTNPDGQSATLTVGYTYTQP